MIRDPAACFAQALAALDGAPVPLTAGGSKTLYYMLDGPQGCDAWLTHEHFVVRYGQHGKQHHYRSEVGVEAVSWLFAQLRARRGVVEAGELPAFGPPEPWRYDARAVWLKATTDQITIQIREATALELSAPPLFAPPDLRPKYIEGTEPCPSCGVVPDRYRELRDGALVCLACGASRKGSRSPSP
ncbi:MAG TPA: hypothetical protein VM513_23915 [Kofleriaceae bacterium]|nr:hypothetical protein [Kofleriaceae bacterium]